MRTTLDIDGEVLSAAEELARRENQTVSENVSKLLRRSLTAVGELAPRVRGQAVAGFVPFYAKPGAVVTNEAVNRLCDQEGI